MYKIGVVGPEESIERILDVAKNFPDYLRFIPLVYRTAKETIEIMDKHFEEYDYFLFSGPIPYEIAKNEVSNHEKFFYVEAFETGFYQALLQIIALTNYRINRLSIDILKTSNIIDISLDQVSVPIKKLIVKEFDPLIDYYELYEHHEELFRKNKIDAVLTCYPEVKKLLDKNNIPAAWISTTKLATQQAIEAIEQRTQISYFKRTQIGVCMIDIDTSIDKEQDETLSNDIQLTTLKMNESLLILSRDMNGSFFEIGDGTYMIISSRGEIIDNLNLLNETIQFLKNSWKRNIVAGIGFGDSSLKAELNARKAISKTESNRKEIVIIDNLGEIMDLPLEKTRVLSTISNNAELLRILKDRNISIQSFERVRDIVRLKKWNQFSSKDLALELNMSNRNAQHLLLSFKEAGIVKQVGEEKVSRRGRPRLLYQIKKSFL